jgi:D-methionine transport system ATP-binding protein
MLSIKDLNKTFVTKKIRFQALKNVSVDINKGEVFGFIGLSGAGKTSLARCISVLEKADSGSVFLNETDITKLKGKNLRDARKKMGFVFQHFHLLMNSTVYNNIAFPLKIAGKPKEFINKRVNELLDLVGLTDKIHAYPAKLSGGQKQRVGIARALAAEPELVICDEATSALDPETTKSILELLRRINKKTGVTIIVITHEMDVIKELCHRVAIMEGGEIIETGKVIDVMTSPQTETALRFFAKSNLSGAEKYADGLLPNEKLVKATFVGESALKPFISDIIRRFNIEVSILSGSIEPVGGVQVGALILKISGSGNDIDMSIAYCTQNGVRIEVIENGNI